MQVLFTSDLHLRTSQYPQLQKVLWIRCSPRSVHSPHALSTKQTNYPIYTRWLLIWWTTLRAIPSNSLEATMHDQSRTRQPWQQKSIHSDHSFKHPHRTSLIHLQKHLAITLSNSSAGDEEPTWKYPRSPPPRDHSRSSLLQRKSRCQRLAVRTPR